MNNQFTTPEMQFGFEIALGATYRQAADAGEVLATAARIEDGNDDSWIDQWIATAGAIRAAGNKALAADRRVSALAYFRRAASYYGAALYRIDSASDPGRQPEIWRRHRECWDHAVDLMPVPGERIKIPYENTTLPGYFFRAPHSQPGEVRPLVIINNGSDGATSVTWLRGGAGASDRGYHWMTFDGPGQNAALFDQGIPFRPDWEAVLTPVLDTMLKRPDVDAERIAVIGISQAGYWVPRALAFEQRFAAAVVDPGVVDISQSWVAPLPAPLQKELNDGNKEAFDREMHLAELLHDQMRVTLDFRGKPYGVQSDSRYDLFKEVSKYRLGDEIAQITTPLLITDNDEEALLPGQSKELYDRLHSTRELVTFTGAEGAG
ncbi:MAG: alpha/beta hydrolase family protein, partial [Solirubrobacteraceae bacterium]